MEIETEVRNAGAQSRQAWAEVSILDSEGRESARRTARFYVKAGGEVTVRQRLELEKPALWSVKTPLMRMDAFI